MWAAEILGWFGDPRAAVPLIESLGDVSPEVRAEAAMGLGEIGDARALKRLLEILLSDPVPFVRTRAAQALGAIGHPKVIDHLIHVLKDPEWWVRIRAIEALEQIGRSAVGALLVALENDDDEVHRRAAMALKRMGYVQESIAELESEGFHPDISRILLLVGKAGVTEILFGNIRAAGERARKLLVRIAGDIGDPGMTIFVSPIIKKLLFSERISYSTTAPCIKTICFSACYNNEDFWPGNCLFYFTSGELGARKEDSMNQMSGEKIGMKRMMVVIAAVILTAWAGSAYAASNTSVSVSATVIGTCKFVAGGTMAFGNLDPSLATNVNASVSQPTFWCTKNAAYTITDDDGENETGTTHQLIGTTNGEFIPYSFTYTASGIGAGPTSTLTMDISGTILGTDYSGVSQDTYSDTVTLTINP